MSDITKAREVWVSTSKNADYVMGVHHEDAVRFVRGDIHERLEAKLAKAVEERDEALNQLDSARHSVDVLEKRIKELKGESHE